MITVLNGAESIGRPIFCSIRSTRRRRDFADSLLATVDDRALPGRGVDHVRRRGCCATLADGAVRVAAVGAIEEANLGSCAGRWSTWSPSSARSPPTSSAPRVTWTALLRHRRRRGRLRLASSPTTPTGCARARQRRVTSREPNAMNSRSLRTSASGMIAQQHDRRQSANNSRQRQHHRLQAQPRQLEDVLYETLQDRRRRSWTSTDSGEIDPVSRQGRGLAGVMRLHTQGATETTQRPLDVAIEGDGFFQVQRPDGTTAYTRDGSSPSLTPAR